MIDIMIEAGEENIILTLIFMIMTIIQTGDGDQNGDIEIGETEDHIGEADTLIDQDGGIITMEKIF